MKATGRKAMKQNGFRNPFFRRRAFVKVFFWMGLIAFCVPRAVYGQGPWRTYENARLNESAYLDGDSFHLKAGRHQAVYRLYFVDAPETDRSFPDRLAEQARYWNITESDVLRFGRKAEKFTRDFLRRGATMYTRRQDAQGRSSSRRYYGMIEVDGEFLCVALVRAGLARVYGYTTDLPDGTPEARHSARLRRLDREARKEGRGAWSVSPEGGGRPSLPPLPPPSWNDPDA